MSERMRTLLAVALILCAWADSSVAAQAPVQPVDGLKLAAVEVVGASRYRPADVARAAGLTIGQAITIEDLEGAANRLAGTGLVSRVAYRYAFKNAQMTVTLEIEEPEWTVPVILDNFVWFPDEELREWLRRDVPTFDGTAPQTEGVTALIAGSLQSLMEARGHKGQVRFLPQTDIKGESLRYLFAVREPAPMLCAAHVVGASAIAEADVLEAVKPFIGSEYSRFTMENVTRGTLLDLYHRRSYWGARFAPIVPEYDAACGGARVRIEVDEGREFVWERTEWAGVTAVEPRALDAAMKLSAGKPAGLRAVQDGLLEVRRLYARQGYITSRTEYEPRLDADRGALTFAVRIAEGPQYRFGSVEFAGGAAPHADALVRGWRLKPGDIYDASYPARFGTDEVGRRIQRSAGPNPRLSIEEHVDEERRLVYVRFVVK